MQELGTTRKKTRFFAKAWIRKHKKTTSNFSDVENQSFSAVSSAASPKNDNLVQFREKGLFSAGSAVLVQKVQNPISSNENTFLLVKYVTVMTSFG